MELTFSSKNDYKTLQSHLQEDQRFHQDDRKFLLLKCVEAKRQDMVQLLLQNGIGVSQDFQGFPLHEAARNGSCDIVKILLKFSFNIDAQDRCGNTPLHISAEEQHYDCVELLLSSGATVDLVNVDGNTALHQTAYRGEYRIMKILLEKGCNPIIENRMKETPLHLLADNDNLQSVRAVMLLLEHGASLSAKYIL